MPDVPEDPFISPSSNQGTPVKQEQKLLSLPATSLNTAAVSSMVDLTMLSSDDGPEIVSLGTLKKKKTMIKLINRNSPVNLVSDSDGTTQIPDADLPPLTDTAAIAKYSHQAWVALSDRERLLISVLHGMPISMRNAIFALTTDTETQLWDHMIEVMDAIRRHGDSVKGMDGDTFEVS
jgi:hypothetical protein